MYTDLHSKFMPLVRRHFPQHYLLQHNPFWFLDYLDKHAATHPYFLRFNIRQFYTSLAQLAIEPVLIDNYEELTGNTSPAQMNQRLHLAFNSKFISKFDLVSLSNSTSNLKVGNRCSSKPCSKGWNHKNRLSYIVGAAYMMGLYHTLSRWPFLCFHDDFVVLFHSKAEIADCLLFVYHRLDQIGLELDPVSLSSGRLDQEGFQFMGFECKGNTFEIVPEKVRAFRHKIIKVTTFTRQYKNQKTFIKQLNRQIDIFGHYYKHGQVTDTFTRIDVFIRKRVRQFLFFASDMEDRTTNLPHGSYELYSNLGLLSLKRLFKENIKKMKGHSSVKVNSKACWDGSPVFNKPIVEKLLQQMLIRNMELYRQQKLVIRLLEHLAPLFDEIIAQPGNSIGIL